MTDSGWGEIRRANTAIKTLHGGKIWESTNTTHMHTKRVERRSRERIEREKKRELERDRE